MKAEPPRVAFCGNIGNTHYQIVKALRSVGYDAHLFIGKDDPLWYRPESDDPTLKNTYPAWLHEGRWLTHLHGVVPNLSPLIRRLDRFDLVVASGTMPVVAQMSSSPVCFLSTGADLTVTPFPWRSRHRRRNWIARIGYFAVAFWQRRALRSAAEVWTQPFRPFTESLEALGVDERRIHSDGVRLAIDTEVFSRSAVVDDTVSPMIAEITARSDFVVFHPTRLVFAQDPESLRTGQSKGSAITLRAFAEFVRSNTAGQPLLVLPERGPELSTAKILVEELGIEKNVYWARPPRAEGFTRSELISFYSIANAVIDEFGAGWFGYVSLEAMSCSVPVISRTDEAALDQLYGSDRFWLSAQGESDAAQRLQQLAASPAWAAEIGMKSRAWVERHHSFDAVHGHYVNLCEAALARISTVSAA